jgi:hypothetical protein
MLPEAHLAGFFQFSNYVEVAGDDLLVTGNEGFVVDLTLADALESRSEVLYQRLEWHY